MPSKNFSATVTIGGAIGSTFKTAIGGVKGAIADLGKSVKTLGDQSRKVSALDPAAVLKAGRAYQQAKRHAEELGASIKAMHGPGGPSKKQLAEFERARVASLRAQKAFETLRQSQHKARDELRALGIDTRKLTSEKARLEAQAEKLARRMRALGVIAKTDVGGAFRNMVSTVRTGALAVAGAAAGIGATIFGLAKSTSDAGDKIAKTSQYLGITTNALQEFRYAGELAGVSADEMDSALEKLTIRVGDTVDPASDLGRAIRRVGLSVQELRDLGADEAMGRIADGIQNIEDPTVRAQTVVQLFGKSAINMVNVLKDGSGALADMRKEAHETGNVMGKEALDNSEAFNDAFYRARQSVLGARNAIGSALLPAVIELSNEFRAFIVSNGPAIRQWASELGKSFRENVPGIIAGTKTFFNVVVSLGSAINSVVEATIGWKGVAIAIGTVLASKVLISVVTLGAALFKVGAAIVTIGATLNPIVLTVLAIGGALVTVAGLVWTYWQPIKEFFSDLGTTIGKVMDPISLGKSVLGTITAPGRAVADFTSDLFGGGSASPAIDAGALRQATGAAAPQVTQTFTVNVTQNPGESSQDFAERIGREMRKQQSALARGALYDTVAP